LIMSLMKPNAIQANKFNGFKLLHITISAKIIYFLKKLPKMNKVQFHNL